MQIVFEDGDIEFRDGKYLDQNCLASLSQDLADGFCNRGLRVDDVIGLAILLVGSVVDFIREECGNEAAEKTVADVIETFESSRGLTKRTTN